MAPVDAESFRRERQLEACCESAVFLELWREYTIALEESARREAKTVLFHGQEDEEVWAAYQLAREASKESVGILASALQDPMESTRRAAAFGLILEALRCREVTSKLETVLLTTLLRYRWNPVTLID